MKGNFKPLFITGLARSGTNLVARMLTVNKDVMVAIDAFLPLFRALRNALVAQRSKGEFEGFFDPDFPLHDFYFDDGQIALMDFLHEGLMDGLTVYENERPLLMERVAARASDDSADLVPYLPALGEVKTYTGLFKSILEITARARDAWGRTWVGPKDVWVIDFFPVLAREFPEAKFIIVLRDPRAIVASNQPAIGTTEFGHPISYARHWRKFIALSIMYGKNELLKDRIKVVFYEDAVTDTEPVMKDVCRFLHIDFDSAMLDAGNFFDYPKGTVWRGNSSFENNFRIDPSRAERWRKTLEPELVRMVDFVCGPEMKLAGYETLDDFTNGCDVSDILLYYLQSNQDPCSWRTDFQNPQKDFGYELFRYGLLKTDEEEIPEDIIRKSFLYRDIFQMITKGRHGVLGKKRIS